MNPAIWYRLSCSSRSELVVKHLDSGGKALGYEGTRFRRIVLSVRSVFRGVGVGKRAWMGPYAFADVGPVVLKVFGSADEVDECSAAVIGNPVEHFAATFVNAIAAKG